MTTAQGLEWLEENDRASKSEILKKKKDLERTISAMMARLFR